MESSSTVGAAQAGESVTKDPTLEETLDGFLHPRAPGPIVSFVEVRITLLELFRIVFQTLIESGALGMAQPVGTNEGHSLPETKASSNLRGHLDSVPRVGFEKEDQGPSEASVAKRRNLARIDPSC